MGKVFNLGRLFDIQFRVHFSWFIIFALVTVFLVSPDYSKWLYWVIAIITSLFFFASVIAHELAHSLVGRATGIPIKSITLFIFGGVAEMTKEVTGPGVELKMAVAGPICSLVISGLFGGLFGLLWFFAPNLTEPIATMILWLAIMNGALAVFNLIPSFPLDGGRVFRSALWRFTGSYSRSTRIATRVGQGIGYSFILCGISIIILRPFGLSWFEGIWIAFIGWFLASAAAASYRQLRRQEALSNLTTAEAITLDSPGAPPDITG